MRSVICPGPASFTLIICLFCAGMSVFSQTDNQFDDSAKVNYKNDQIHVLEKNVPETNIFDSLKTKTNGKWLASTLYRTLVRSQSSELYGNDPHAMVSAEERFAGYNGRVIRNIYMVKEDVVPQKHADSLRNNPFLQLGRYHINTQSWRLKQQLHIRQGDTVNAYELADEERLLRSLHYIYRAKVHVEPTFSPDSVDVIIVTRDAFPINTEVEMTDIGRYSGSVVHRNILGLGMQIGAKYYYDDPENPPSGFGLAFANYNIWRTHSSLYLNTTQTAYRKKMHVKIDRPFQTRQTRVAGAAEYYELWEVVTFASDTIDRIMPVSNLYKNAWLGFSVPLPLKPFNSFICAGRIFQNDVKMRPLVTPNSYYLYHDKTMWLQSLQFRKIRYFNTGFVRSQGVLEDVPYGQMLEFLFGYETAEFFSRPYVGARLFLSRYNMFKGYYAAKLSGGTFWGESQKFEQAVLSMDHEYFSNLYSMGRFHYRQFVSLSATYGMRRFPEESILAKETVPGLSSRYLQPFQSKTVVHLESFLFAPWRPAQFRFTFSMHADFAAVSSSQNMIDDYVPLASFGAGVRVRNERLFIQNLAIRFNYYLRSDLYNQHFGGTISTSSPKRYNTMQPGQPEVVPLK